MLDPVALRSFLAVEREGSFTGGGRSLNLRQSTVSGHIARLEKSVGRELFRRDTRNLELTADGSAMMGFARTILNATEDAERYFAGSQLAGRIRFGVCDDLVATEIPQLLLQFRQTYPQIDVELSVGLSETLRSKLDAGDLDIVFGKRRPGETHGELVWRDRLVWAGLPGPRDPFENGPIPLVTYPPPSITRSSALAVLDRAGLGWRTTCVTDSLLGLRAAVMAGLGYMVHALGTLPDGVVPIEGLPDPGGIEFVLIMRGSSPSPERALRDAIMARLSQ